MVSNEDWSALMSSEIFRSYASNELKKEAIDLAEQDKLNKKAFEDFEQLKLKAETDPIIRQACLNMRWEIINNPDMISSIDKTFLKWITSLEIK